MNHSILDFYPIALAEKEGAGTAYEYVAKARVVKKFIGNQLNSTKILVAGLPEKYGFSMDFAVLAEELNSSILYVDDRKTRLEEFEKILNKLINEKVILGSKINISHKNQLHKLDNLGDFSLFFSCEVLQRLTQTDRVNYINQFLKPKMRGVIFAPNGANKQHAKLSGLNAILPNELDNLIKHMSKDFKYKTGLIDMPPFPPGIKRSNEARARAKDNNIEKTFFKIIELWGYGESLLPQWLKQSFAHIIYLTIKAKHENMD